MSLGMILYLTIAISMAGSAWRSTPCEGLMIDVQDSTACNFVTSDSILKELGDLPRTMRTLTVASVNTDSVERLLNRLASVEEAQVVRMPDGTIYIKVVPMQPVARIFDTKGESYYVNRQGKRMPAQLRYRIDVPVVVNQGYHNFDPTYLLPVIDYLDTDSAMRNTITAINVDRQGDIFLVPSICGHVLNIGDTANLANKFERYHIVCRDILPHKGWDCYDTISVKWNGQLVGSYRDNGRGSSEMPDIEFIDEEDDDVANMLTDTTQVAAKPEPAGKPDEKGSAKHKS